MYLNEVFYGNQSYGVEAAAQSYFDKHARDLDLAEAALIAGLVQSPSEYDPTRRDVPRTADGIPLETKERQAYVLEQMTRHGFITEQQARDAYAEPLVDQAAPRSTSRRRTGSCTSATWSSRSTAPRRCTRAA